MKRLSILLIIFSLFRFTQQVSAEPLQIAIFSVDATPPIGSPVSYALTRKIDDPLSARGVVLLTSKKPIILCAVDFIGIGNGSQDVWREKIAMAAGTTMDRVVVHALHQHDGPRCDFTVESLLASRKLTGRIDVGFARDTIERVAKAIRQAMKSPQSVTHIGVGKAKVEKVASNRRILGPDGKVAIIRWSRSKDPKAIAAPEGVIDPFVRMVSFWNGKKPLTALSWYATHPMSYYGQGDVSSDFIGIAREQRQKTVGIPHIHFNGAGGNITAGKYNDGSKERRPILAARVALGMKQAWESTKKLPIDGSDVSWRVRPVHLPVGKHLELKKLKSILDNPKADKRQRVFAAEHLVWLQRNTAGRKINISCLQMNDTYVLHMPGELFIEYQIAAQKMRPRNTVCMAAYGDYGPGYIGTKISYSQGGYETSNRATRVGPDSEAVLMTAMQELLQVEK